MKQIVLITILLFSLPTLMVSCKNEIDTTIIEPQGTPEGTAIIITGASARISHEIALLEKLAQLGEMNDVQLIAGLSSGGISSIALNAILDSTRTSFTWSKLKEIIFHLTSSDLYINDRNDLPVDNRRMWRFFDTIVKKKMNIQTMTDLKYPTILTTVRLENRKKAKSTNISQYQTLTSDPTEALMSTASIPVIFPAIRINGEDYVDGGLEEIAPIEEALEYQLLRGKPFKKIIIVTHQSNKTMDWEKETSLMKLSGVGGSFLTALLEGVSYNMDGLGFHSFVNSLKTIKNKYPTVSARTWVYVPDVANPPYFGLMDFDHEEEAYNLVSNWAESNLPIPLDIYVIGK